MHAIYSIILINYQFSELIQALSTELEVRPRVLFGWFYSVETKLLHSEPKEMSSTREKSRTTVVARCDQNILAPQRPSVQRITEWAARKDCSYKHLFKSPCCKRTNLHQFECNKISIPKMSSRCSNITQSCATSCMFTRNSHLFIGRSLKTPSNEQQFGLQWWIHKNNDRKEIKRFLPNNKFGFVRTLETTATGSRRSGRGLWNDVDIKIHQMEI